MSELSRNAPGVLRSASADETRALGRRLGRLVAAGDIVLLDGDLGAGKTVFTQGIGDGLGVAEAVNSPTFTLLKEYTSGRLPLYHFDLYRIASADEVVALGFEDYFGGEGVAVVEWAARGEASDAGDGGEAAWPADWLRVSLRALGGETRELRLSAAGARGDALLRAFAAEAAPALEGEPPRDGASRRADLANDDEGEADAARA